MKRFWISWWEPTAEDLDARPVVSLNEAVRGAWMTGNLISVMPKGSPAVSCCAVVDAADANVARALIERHWHPHEWRFCNEKPADWMPPADRFPAPVKATGGDR